MKKGLLLLLILLALCLCACGAAAPAEEAPAEETAEAEQAVAEDTAADAGSMLEITQSGWVIDKGFLYYYIVLHNNDSKNAVLYPSFYINARNSEGTLINTYEQTLSVIYPGEDFYYGSQAFEITEEPATVEFEAAQPADYNIKPVTSEVKPLKIVSAVLSGDKVVGEVSNENDEDIPSAAVVVLFKDDAGNYVAGDTTYTDNLPANGTVPFSAFAYHDFVTDSFDVFAYEW